jgi:hypothetical protein
MRRARSRTAGASGDRQGTVVDVLAAAPAFAGCSPEALRSIAALGTEVQRGAGAVLATSGTVLRQVAVVLDGVVAERPASGRERAVSAGHVVGEEALTTPHATAGNGAVALTDVRLLVVGPGEIADVAELARQRLAAPAARRVRRPARELAWTPARAAIA